MGRNPGLFDVFPDFAALHPVYGSVINSIFPRRAACSRQRVYVTTSHGTGFTSFRYTTITNTNSMTQNVVT